MLRYQSLLEWPVDIQLPFVLAVPVLSARRSRDEFCMGDCSDGSVGMVRQSSSRIILQAYC